MKDSLPFSLHCEIELTESIEFALKQLSQAQGGGALTHLSLQEDAELPDQGYRRKVDGSIVSVSSSSTSGFLYGILDLLNPDWTQSRTVVPHIKKRGIKYNIPFDVRTPSYSDASDMAMHSRPKVWEFSFWMDFLDTMALNKYNLLSLWSLSPFPTLVRPKEFPAIALDDVLGSSVLPSYTMSGHGLYEPDMYDRQFTIKELGFDKKVSFFNDVLTYAKSRCIEIYLFTWNLFTYGTEHSSYGITDDMDNLVTKAYLYSSVTALLETYPLLAGLGVTAGEHMSSDAQKDIPYLHETYAQAISDYLDTHPQRQFQFIHRTHWAAAETIKKYYRAYKHPFALSFKYSQAHLHTVPDPPFLRQFLEETTTSFPLFLTLRDDDYYLHRWANYSFAQDYIKAIPQERIEGFYFGSDGYSWGWETVSCQLSGQLYLQKMWLKIALFGQLSYNPEVPKTVFESLFSTRYPSFDRDFFSYWELASSLINLVTCLHFRDWDFQWYPEGCCQFVHPPIAKLQFVDILGFLEGKSMSGSSYRSIKETCLGERAGTESYDAVYVYTQLYERTEKIFSYIKPMLSDRQLGGEEAELAGDVYSLALLGCYYAHKIEAAYLLGKAVLNKEEEAVQVEHLLREAVKLWRMYSFCMHQRYKPQRFARLCSYIDFRMFDQSAEHDVFLAKETLAKALRGEYVLVP